MKALSYIGKFLFAIPLFIFGLFHFMNASAMSGMVPGMFPYSEVWVYITGVALILAAVALIVNKKARLAMTLLGVMLLIFAITVHLPGFLQQDHYSSANFLKDLALSGAAFFIGSKLKD